MRMPIHFPDMIRIVALCAVTSLLLASCSGGSAELASLESAEPHITLQTMADSDWQLEDLQLELQDAGDGSWFIAIRSSAIAESAETLLLQGRMDRVWQLVDARQECAQGELNLLVSERPGVLALGVVGVFDKPMAGGELLLSGRLMRVDTATARLTSAVPQNDSGLVSDLTGNKEDVGYLIEWGYVNRADYDQNSEANIADLTPLSTRLGESTTDGDDDEYDSVLDGDGNTEVNLADITPLAVNFLNSVSRYRVYRSDGPDLGTATVEQLAEINFADSSLLPRSRRHFSVLLSDANVAPGDYLFVRPWDSASDTEGPASNLHELPLLSNAKYLRAPSGDDLVDDGQCISPDLLSCEAFTDYSEAGAPFLVYIRIGDVEAPASLMLAWYGEAGWTTQEIGGGAQYSACQALLQPSLEGPPTPVVLAHEVNGNRLVARYYDADWNFLSEKDAGSATGALTALSAELAADGELCAASAWADGAGSTVLVSSSIGGADFTSDTAYSGTDTLGGISFRFDPVGGDPWLVYSHGTINTDQTLLLDFSLEVGRRSSGVWNFDTLATEGSPLLVDLGFRADNTPQLLFTSARDTTIEIPTQDPVTLSLLIDVYSAEYNGSAWDIQRAFESSFGVNFAKILSGLLTLELELAPAASWAAPDQLLYVLITGSVDISVATQQPEGGDLSSANQYMQRGAGHAYSDSAYYTGQSGRNFAWAEVLGQAACGYVRSSDVNVDNLLAGNFSAAGELAFWRP
ncbi:hypothetical protein KDL44_05830 [bacterium]|nr:hypothetical protein [bacterium]